MSARCRRYLGQRPRVKAELVPARVRRGAHRANNALPAGSARIAFGGQGRWCASDYQSVSGRSTKAPLGEPGSVVVVVGGAVVVVTASVVVVVVTASVVVVAAGDVVVVVTASVV